MTTPHAVDVDRVLASLKPFQRHSVDYVFSRLYGPNPTRRFLLADEVGLGKTLVGRGVIAKTIVHLQSQGADRVNIVYICSNADIARQNISRLNVTDQEDFQLATRITRLPEVVHELEDNPLNFISFTPGTSFSFGRSTGEARERRLLYFLLERAWPRSCRGAGAKNLLQVGMTRRGFRHLLRDYDPSSIDPSIAKAFVGKLRKRRAPEDPAGATDLNQRFRNLCVRFRHARKNIPKQDALDRNALISELRGLLAATCIDALQPDLIVLDEFQRFKDLLDPEDPAGALARNLFRQSKTRILLLSATPYKMYTMAEEVDDEDHYEDFVATLGFLHEGDAAKTKQMTDLLADYSRSVRAKESGLEHLRGVKQQVEAQLRQVMCRTERLAVTEDRRGMLIEVESPQAALEPRHVKAYLDVRRISDALKHPDVVEYWKASPYLLSFMDAEHYKLKDLLRNVAEHGGSPDVAEAVTQAETAGLDRRRWQRYEDVNLCHVQLERLSAQTIGAGWWRLLWIPPALPYYELSGAFADVTPAAVTKRLVFSGWHVVPRAISVLISYEAERRMMKGFDPGAANTKEASDSHRPLLTFGRTDGRFRGMPVLALLYPSIALASMELTAGKLGSSERQTLAAVLERVGGEITTALRPVLRGAPTSGNEDEAWYWAAPILLDRLQHKAETEDWFSDPESLAAKWSGKTDEGIGWLEHVRYAASVADGDSTDLGRPPEDLAEVLALLAVAGPAVCALRALARTCGDASLFVDGHVRQAAGRLAWGLRSLFNTPEVTALIRGMNSDEPYWRRVLEYSAAGCLQAVIDEYLHVLLESEGQVDKPVHKAVDRLAECAGAAAGLRAATPGLDWVRAGKDGTVRVDNQRVRARFAMRFGDEHADRDGSGVRKDDVRQAFNSPFWPFVLATTSIGQEGLDFHTYCHAVVHWNLPSNPVDMEQREGRVHRYKGHAVRKNVARVAARDEVTLPAGANPWIRLFQHAVADSKDPLGLKPFWVFPMDGGASIERHVGALPLSREAARLPGLRASLAVYRMVFGQPRQDDLVEYLKRSVPAAELPERARALTINLEPASIDLPADET